MPVAVVPFSAEQRGYARAGAAGAHSVEYAEAGLNTPNDSVHQSYPDYWGIGARVIAAFFFVDFWGDDTGNGSSDSVM